MPDNFSVIVNETVTIWSAIKITLVVVAGLYLIVAGITWDKRALSAVVLCLAMWLLAGCTLNEGTRPADALIAASQASASSAAAQAAAQQQAAQLAAQQQQAQLTALEIAQANAQEERSAAIAAQAAENGLEAQENAAQAAVMSSAIIALDNANARAAERSTWLGWLLVALVAGGLALGGLWVYWHGRVRLAMVQRQQPQLTDDQLRAVARGAGYIEEHLPNGHYQIVNPRTGHLISRHQLQLEGSGPAPWEEKR